MEPEKRKSKQRKTEAIFLGAALSTLIVAGCSGNGERDQRRCIDPKTGKVVESYQCEDDETRRRYAGATGWTPHVWYWGGTGYSGGDMVSGGHYDPPRSYRAPGYTRSGSLAGGRVTHVSAMSRGAPSGVARGGFGGSAVAHGSGGS
ncbi:MAG: hypothetical protein LLG06_19210 [Desulfobacteraceae bacterium]|nr:hypothetical protein [Desulfobacteraceae bacterium]